MNLFECIKSAVNQLLGNKMRSFLTMLGMFIGIGSVIMVLGLGSGVKGMMLATFENIGRGAVIIQTSDWSPEYMITHEDIEAIKELPEVKEAILIGETWRSDIKNYKREDDELYIRGIPYNYDAIEHVDLTAGRMYTESEENAKAQVCVVSDAYAKRILGTTNNASALGKTIEVELVGEKHTFEIVGLMKTEGFIGMPDEMVNLSMYIPFSTIDQITN
ncbi:MAG: ABC transporter permease, partial [Niameybacter sp.]